MYENIDGGESQGIEVEAAWKLTDDSLFMKSPEDVKEAAREQIEMGLDILAPGCAVAPGTPTENLLAMVEVAQEYTY